MRLLSLLFLATTGSLSSQADTGVVLWHESGGSDVFLLADKPVISYRGDSIVLKTETAEVAYPVAGISRITFEDTATGIGSVSAASGKGVVAKVSGGGVEIWGMEPLSRAEAYTVSGTLIGSYTADGDGHLAISLDGQAKGVIIIKTTKASIKTIRK